MDAGRRQRPPFQFAMPNWSCRSVVAPHSTLKAEGSNEGRATLTQLNTLRRGRSWTPLSNQGRPTGRDAALLSSILFSPTRLSHSAVPSGQPISMFELAFRTRYPNSLSELVIHDSGPWTVLRRFAAVWRRSPQYGEPHQPHMAHVTSQASHHRPQCGLA